MNTSSHTEKAAVFRTSPFDYIWSKPEKFKSITVDPGKLTPPAALRHRCAGFEIDTFPRTGISPAGPCKFNSGHAGLGVFDKAGSSMKNPDVFTALADPPAAQSESRVLGY